MPLATVGLILILPAGISTSVATINFSTPYIMQVWGFGFSQNIYFSSLQTTAGTGGSSLISIGRVF